LQKEVARTLGISPKTVSTHVERIHQKLGAHNRMEAVARAQQAGIL
jgi:DNA-binding CsgD family transcriptional regulator